VIIITFFIQSQSLFTLFLDPLIHVVKIGIFKITRHKLCKCLQKLLVKKYLFFVLSNNMSKVLLSSSHQILFTFKVCNFIVDTLYLYLKSIFKYFFVMYLYLCFKNFLKSISTCIWYEFQNEIILNFPFFARITWIKIIFSFLKHLKLCLKTVPFFLLYFLLIFKMLNFFKSTHLERNFI